MHLDKPFTSSKENIPQFIVTEATIGAANASLHMTKVGHTTSLVARAC